MLSPIRRFTRMLASRHLPTYFRKNSNCKPIKICDKVIVSLTSYPARIEFIWQTISSLLRQTYRPSKVILWLSKTQFESQALPESLLNLQSDVFEIRFVDNDIRSHKKYVYAFAEFSDNLIITVDDDLIYSPRLVESLVKMHEIYPDDVLCRYGKKIGRCANGSLMPYKEWRGAVMGDEDVFFGSGGGTLFQPSKLYKDVLDVDLALQLTPLADDIWLNVMCILAGLRIRLITNELFLFFDKDESNSLSGTNVGMSQNDIQIANIIKYYKEAKGVDPFAMYKSNN